MVLAYGTARAESPIATPAIDPTIFKDGALESREFGFGKWHAKCQEIIKVKRRICNLLSSINDAAGDDLGSVLIATTDTGVLAMIVALPLKISENKLLYIEASQSGNLDGKTVKVEYSNTIRPMLCDTSCKFMFPLDSRLVFILNSGESAKVAIRSELQNTMSEKNKRKKAAVHENLLEFNYAISGNGFAETLSKSTKPW